MKCHMLSMISKIKQKVFCNADLVIYITGSNNDESGHDNLPCCNPQIPLQYNVITNGDELFEHLQDIEIGHQIHKFRYFLSRGCKLYVAFIDNNIVGYYWVTDLSKFKPYLYTENQLFDGNVTTYFVFFCKTFENYRNLGIYSYMLTQICRDPCFYDGRIMISTDLTNSASQRGIEKAGFKKFFALRYLNIGGVKLLDNFKIIDGC